MARLAREKAADTKTDDGDLLFAIGYTAEMLEALQVDYMAGYEERKSLEP